jgi:hypothetical protein
MARVARTSFVRTIVWRPISTAPKDGRLIEVAWLGPVQTKRPGPKRTRWQEGTWSGAVPYEPDHWRPIERESK